MDPITAVRLGTEHGMAGIPPWGGPDGNGAARLMNALGETDPTTEANHPRRIALNDTYWDAYRWAAGICFECGADGATEDVNAELLCRPCASEYDATVSLPPRDELIRIIRAAANGSSIEQLADHILRELNSPREPGNTGCGPSSEAAATTIQKSRSEDQ